MPKRLEKLCEQVPVARWKNLQRQLSQAISDICRWRSRWYIGSNLRSADQSAEMLSEHTKVTTVYEVVGYTDMQKLMEKVLCLRERDRFSNRTYQSFTGNKCFGRGSCRPKKQVDFLKKALCGQKIDKSKVVPENTEQSNLFDEVEVN